MKINNTIVRMLVRIYTIEFSKNYLEIGTALLSLYALQPDTIKELKKRSVFARGTFSGLCFLKKGLGVSLTFGIR